MVPETSGTPLCPLPFLSSPSPFSLSAATPPHWSLPHLGATYRQEVQGSFLWPHAGAKHAWWCPTCKCAQAANRSPPSVRSSSLAPPPCCSRPPTAAQLPTRRARHRPGRSDPSLQLNRPARCPHTLMELCLRPQSTARHGMAQHGAVRDQQSSQAGVLVARVRLHNSGNGG